MSNSVQNVNTIKPGTCPHGCAPGACPICSNMGGGSLRAGERVQKPGEMSYHECAMIGAMMKARAAQQRTHEHNLQSRAEALKEFEQKLVQISNNLSQFISKISQNFALKPVALVLNITIRPVLFIAKNIIGTINSIISKLSQLKIDIQDKLNAIFGETKAFIEKKVSELVSSIKSKFEGLFKIFRRNKTRDDDTKIDEDKKIFRLKTFINRILRKNKDGSGNGSED